MTQEPARYFFCVAFRLLILTGRLKQVRKAPSQVAATQTEQAECDLRADGNEQAHTEHDDYKCNHGVKVLKCHFAV